LLGAAWLALLLTAAAFAGRTREMPQPTAAAAGDRKTAIAVEVVDASGHTLPRRAYRRIASASAYADQLLLALAEPERVIALSHNGRAHDPDAFRYGARAEISSPGELERLLALRADLLLVNHLGAESELARVRASGIAVFDLGEMRGVSSLETSILKLASALSDRGRGERLWSRWSWQFAAVARDIAPERRKRALYVAIYAGKLYGGTVGTSYHDVLEAAGLIDLAAQRYRDWPNYDPEQLLALDPPLLVTERGMADPICSNEWLRELSACKRREAGAIVEIDSQLLGNPGLGMLDAAEALRARVYPLQ
jgi:ABC-type Fe3+-hydroxamate transport system substrate-binding protein